MRRQACTSSAAFESLYVYGLIPTLVTCFWMMQCLCHTWTAWLQGYHFMCLCKSKGRSGTCPLLPEPSQPREATFNCMHQNTILKNAFCPKGMIGIVNAHPRSPLTPGALAPPQQRRARMPPAPLAAAKLLQASIHALLAHDALPNRTARRVPPAAGRPAVRLRD